MSDCEFNFHTGARHWNNLDCRNVCHGARGTRQLEEQKVEEQKVEVAAEPAPVQGDLPCKITCPVYMKWAFQHGIAEYDLSDWCTSGLDLCYSGNCMSDCEFNFHTGARHWNNLNCNMVCHGARGNRHLEEQKVEEPKVEEQKVEVAVDAAPVQDDLPCNLTCVAYLKYAFQHGIAEYDVSDWCTSGLDLCYSGNCMSDREFNFHTGARH